MLKRKENFKIIVISLVIFSLFLNNNEEIIENSSNTLAFISDYRKVSSEEFLMVLRIPKINLENKIYDFASKYNDIKYNVTILKESTLPNIENSHLILVAHSGTGRIAFFKNLIKLNKNDVAQIVYQNKIYEYKVKEIMVTNKGKLVTISKEDKKMLTLITCIGKEKRLIIDLELNSVSDVIK